MFRNTSWTPRLNLKRQIFLAAVFTSIGPQLIGQGVSGCPECSTIWSRTAVPAVPSTANDSRSVEVGNRSKFDVHYVVSAVDAGGESPNSSEVSAQPSGTLSGCPACVTIWGPSATPAVVDSSDGGSVELGVVFSSDVSGSVYGVQFYKGPTNTGTHVGNLWSATGTKLASATFFAETASGWQ